jgi:ABC-type transporter Mla MlaB component
MLKISEDSMTDETLTLRLAGSVSGPWVSELRRLCEPALSGEARLTLDLADVWFVDAEGVALFRELRGHQVTLQNCSPFVAEQLNGVRR